LTFIGPRSSFGASSIYSSSGAAASVVPVFLLFLLFFLFFLFLLFLLNLLRDLAKLASPFLTVASGAAVDSGFGDALTYSVGLAAGVAGIVT
jgi:hypothetical protein